MCHCHGNMNKYKQAFIISFVYLQKVWSLKSSHATSLWQCSHHFKSNLTERSLIIPCSRFTEISRISFFKVQIFFKPPFTYFLKYFHAKFYESLVSGSQEIAVCPRWLFRIQLQFFDSLHMLGI